MLLLNASQTTTSPIDIKRHVCLRTHLWWSLCTLYLLACQVRVTAGDSGLCCCVHVASFECQLIPLVITSYLYHGAMGNLPMKSNLLATTQPSCFEAGMFSTGQPFLSLISLTVSVDVMHHVYFIGQPHLDILLRCPASNTKGRVSSELLSSTCTTWDKTSARCHMHGTGES